VAERQKWGQDKELGKAVLTDAIYFPSKKNSNGGL